MKNFIAAFVMPDHLNVSFVRCKHDGSWEVGVSERLLGIHASAVDADVQRAADAACAAAQPQYEAARAKWDAAQEAAAARIAAGVTTPSGGGARPTGEPRRGGSAVVIGWDGPVPRNAAHWEAQRTETGELSGIRVILTEGLYFDGGQTEKTFKTLRQAKDETRAASSVKQGSLF